MVALEVEHPEPRLYALDGPDTVVATRMKADGRYEHAVLGEHGMPIARRTYKPNTAIRPDLN